MARKNAKYVGPWCRLYASILDNTKLERLSDSQFRMWAKAMALAVLHKGLIPLDLADISIRLRKPVGRVRDSFQVLCSANLMEKTPEGYILHDWEEMQFDSDVSTGRVKEFRERQKTLNETPTETALKRFIPVAETLAATFVTEKETAPEAEAEAEAERKKDAEPNGSGASADLARDRPAWWPLQDRYGRIVSDLTDKIVFDVGKAVLGKSAGGQIKKLLGLYRDFRATTDLLLQAEGKSNPGEWIAAVIRNRERDCFDDLPTLRHEKYPEAAYR